LFEVEQRQASGEPHNPFLIECATRKSSRRAQRTAQAPLKGLDGYRRTARVTGKLSIPGNVYRGEPIQRGATAGGGWSRLIGVAAPASLVEGRAMQVVAHGRAVSEALAS
jgi:hypothetical protein